MFYTLQLNAERELSAKIDKDDYDESQLITITVPLSMPYLSDTKKFEKKDGVIALNGKIYHYVKEKISQGNLVLMCLPDTKKMDLQIAENDFIKNQIDLQNNASKKSGGNNAAFKLVMSDYIKTDISSISFSNYILNKIYAENNFIYLQKGETQIPERPPRV